MRSLRPAPSQLEDFVERVGVRLRAQYDTAELDAAAAEVLTASAARAVEALLLKGPALAQLLYRPGETRSTWTSTCSSPRETGPGTAGAGGAWIPQHERDARESTTSGASCTRRAGSAAVPARDRELLIELHLRMAGARARRRPCGTRSYPGAAPGSSCGSPSPRSSTARARRCISPLHAAQHGPATPRASTSWHSASSAGRSRYGSEPPRWPGRSTPSTPSPRGCACRRSAASSHALSGCPERAPRLGDQAHGRQAARDLPPGGARRARGLLPRAAVIRRALLPSRQWIAWQYPWARSGRLEAVAGLRVASGARARDGPCGRGGSGDERSARLRTAGAGLALQASRRALAVSTGLRFGCSRSCPVDAAAARGRPPPATRSAHGVPAGRSPADGGAVAGRLPPGPGQLWHAR